MFDETLATRAVVRVDSGGAHGTGVFVDERIVLTCDHVAAGSELLTIKTADGRTLMAHLDRDLSVPDSDVAVLRTNGDAPAVLPVSRAPIAPWERLWSRGFQLQAGALRDALPVTGVAEGATRVRYSSARREYDIDGAIAVTNLTNPGASGGPLVTTDGVVVALVSSKFSAGGGFAIPLSLASAGVPALAEWIDAQGDRVPAFGRFLNRAGARTVCGRIRDRVVKRLVERGQYLPAYAVQRRDLAGSLEAFRAQSEKPLLLVSGPSGTGKSFAMCALATPPFAVLLTADHFHPNDQSIQENLARDAAMPTSDVDRMAVVTRGELLLLVDGLNEMRASLADVRTWIERSVDWLSTHHAKLVVTLRDDFWNHIADLLPHHVIYRVDDRYDEPSAPSVVLGTFDDTELREAATRYGLPVYAHHDPLLRLPFVFRLQKELGAAVGTGSGIAQLVEQFIAVKAKAIGRALQPPSSPQAVRATLRQLAAHVDPEAGLAIRADDFVATCGTPAMAAAVLSENIIVETGSAFRFGFDSVAEFLAGEQMPLPSADAEAWAALLASRPWHAPLRFRILAQEGKSSFDETLRAILSVADHTNDRDVALHASSLALTVLESTRNVAAEHVLRLAEPSRGLRRLPPRLLVDLAARSDISARDRVRAARKIAPTIDPYDWEWGHWVDRDFETFCRERSLGHTRWRSFMAIIADALDREDRRDAIDELLTWLGDRAPLRDSRASIENIAEAFLFHYRDRDFDGICERLGRMQNDSSEDTSRTALRLLHAVASHDARIVSVLKHWAERATPWWDEIIALVLNVTSSHRDDESVRGLTEVVHALIARDHGVAGTAAIAAAGTLPGFDLLEILGARFRANAPGLSGFAFRPYVADRFDEVVAILRQYFAQPNCDPRRAQEALVASADNGDMDGVALVRFLTEVFDTHPRLRTTVARAAEYRLYRADVAAGEWKSLLTLVRRIIREGPSDAFAAIVYFLNSHDTNDGKESTRRELIALAVEACPHTEAREQLFDLLAERYSAERADFETVVRLAESLDGRPFGERFMDRLPFAPRLLEIVVDRVHDDPRIDPDVRRAFQDELRKGTAAPKALLRVVAPWSQRLGD